MPKTSKSCVICNKLPTLRHVGNDFYCKEHIREAFIAAGEEGRYFESKHAIEGYDIERRSEI